jgi:hypothetical protein
MIAGTVILEDVTIVFNINQTSVLANVTICERTTIGENTEHYTTNARDFMSALAIAVHYDGTPDADKDYPAAERAMGEIRWIP